VNPYPSHSRHPLEEVETTQYRNRSVPAAQITPFESFVWPRTEVEQRIEL